MRAISKAKPNCFIAQLVEPATVNRVVLGSSPSEAVKKVPMQVGTFFCYILAPKNYENSKKIGQSFFILRREGNSVV